MLTRRHSIWRALVLGISVVLAVGLAQKSLSWRHTNLHDILAGVTGVAIGIAAARARPSRRLRDSINQRRLVHPWLVLAASAWILVLVRHWWTNDFRVIVEAPDQRYIKMSMVSFYAFYSAHPWGALQRTLLKFLLPVPIGLLLRMASPGGGPPGTQPLKAVAIIGVATIVLVAAELGPSSVPTRLPDVTSVLISAAGVLTGLRIGTALARRQSSPRDTVSG